MKIRKSFIKNICPDILQIICADKQLDDFNSRRDELIGQVIEVEFNDITKKLDAVFNTDMKCES